MDAAEEAEWVALFEAIWADPLYQRLQAYGNRPLYRIRRRRYPPQSRNSACACGSGKKWKRCHGR